MDLRIAGVQGRGARSIATASITSNGMGEA
jgi:hypothetical protein